MNKKNAFRVICFECHQTAGFYPPSLNVFTRQIREINLNGFGNAPAATPEYSPTGALRIAKKMSDTTSRDATKINQNKITFVALLNNNVPLVTFRSGSFIFPDGIAPSPGLMNFLRVPICSAQRDSFVSRAMK